MSSSFVIILVGIAISLIGNLTKAARKEQSRKGRPQGNPAIPYTQSAPTAQQPERPVAKAFEGLKVLLQELEGEGQVVRQVRRHSLRPAAPAKKPAAPALGEGMASDEGEDTLHASHRVEGRTGDPVEVSRRAAAFANREEMRRAVIMSEVLGKPVSLRARSAR